MTGGRSVIVNADDFGQSPGVNRGVIQAHEQGIVTSTSLMVHWSAAAEAAAYARRHPRLGVGLHLDLGEWAYREGDWVHVYRVVDKDDAPAIAAEVASQIQAFERLIGRPPTHLDSHQHVHRTDPTRSIVLDAARRLDVPVREFSVAYRGGFYGQDGQGVSYPEWVGVAGLIRILASLGPGLTEIGCHPAAVDDLETMYRAERLVELATLCDPRVRGAIAEMEIELTSFAAWRRDVRA
jgi:predicted glycoside hydrolase/deacetylase ChbG (UPF0249 family)